MDLRILLIQRIADLSNILARIVDLACNLVRILDCDRLLARRASRTKTPLEQKMDAQILGKKGNYFQLLPFEVYLIYLKRNSFNSHYYYTFDILMVYLAE
jgi:hypothetical protein